MTAGVTILPSPDVVFADTGGWPLNALSTGGNLLFCHHANADGGIAAGTFAALA